MAMEYRYAVYNPGQYPADVQAQWDAMVADGWQVHTVAPNYSEVGIFWHRELPEDDGKSGCRRRAGKSGAADSGKDDA